MELVQTVKTDITEEEWEEIVEIGMPGKPLWVTVYNGSTTALIHERIVKKLGKDQPSTS